jgi:predicted anti-sigma-YlaC factor YlaD
VRRRPSGLVLALDARRAVLLVVAATQLALSLPLLVAGEQGATGHVTRELGAFSVAFAAGLLVVVWQPHRAAGLLPVAVALAAALVLGAGADLLSGRTAPLAEGHHLVELVGLGLLRGVARTSGAPGRARLAAA